MLRKIVDCRKCGAEFERVSRPNKVCPACFLASKKDRAIANKLLFNNRVKEVKLNTYTVVDEDERLVGFLSTYSRAEAEQKLKNGQQLYGEKLVCAYK